MTELEYSSVYGYVDGRTGRVEVPFDQLMTHEQIRAADVIIMQDEDDFFVVKHRSPGKMPKLTSEAGALTMLTRVGRETKARLGNRDGK